jgi:membrane associated rhomboid family serine protease/antitoxin component YwqK of YwqJK toxin-antitoxin module
MDFIRRFPVTVFLLLANCLVFAGCYYQAKTFSEPVWMLTLVRMGAEFNPLTLDHEWYRLFTHMFLHGHLMHLALNMYALFVAGSTLEPEVGSGKFIWVYFLSGLAAALNSLYWNLFTVGVGASGAIFGLFGFSVVLNLLLSHRKGLPVTSIIINFAIFLAVNLLFAKAFHADNAAHLGGLAMGAALAGLAHLQNDYQRIKAEYLLLPLLIVIFFLLPRYQVSYYHFFMRVLAQEDSAKALFSNRSLTDAQLAEGFKKENSGWDSTLKMLDRQKYLPEVLHNDTFKLRRYIGLRKRENDFRITMVTRESYIYLDSIEFAGDQMKPFLHLDYVPPRLRQATSKEPPPDDRAPQEPIQVWFDEDWIELASGPGKFYRIGVRDSLLQWQGKVRDFYGNGEIQMKGGYRNNEHDGVFIYYSDHHTYESAGRYSDGRRVGKWENYYHNGRLESEEYYGNRFFLKNYWDSTGIQQVKDGFGHVVKHYADGTIAEEGDYRDGNQESIWKGYHANGGLFFEEYYVRGRLVRGRSQNPQGKTFIYDESSFYPVPADGWRKMESYLHEEARKVSPRTGGRVRLSFRVTTKSTIADIKVEKSLSKELDAKAKEILLHSPPWLPAHTHGFEPADGLNYVNIDFTGSSN